MARVHDLIRDHIVFIGSVRRCAYEDVRALTHSVLSDAIGFNASQHEKASQLWEFFGETIWAQATSSFKCEGKFVVSAILLYDLCGFTTQDLRFQRLVNRRVSLVESAKCSTH